MREDDSDKRRADLLIAHFEESVPYMEEFASILSDRTGIGEREVLILYAMFLAKLSSE